MSLSINNPTRKFLLLLSKSTLCCSPMIEMAHRHSKCVVWGVGDYGGVAVPQSDNVDQTTPYSHLSTFL